MYRRARLMVLARREREGDRRIAGRPTSNWWEATSRKKQVTEKLQLICNECREHDRSREQRERSSTSQIQKHTGQEAAGEETEGGGGCSQTCRFRAPDPFLALQRGSRRRDKGINVDVCRVQNSRTRKVSGRGAKGCSEHVSLQEALHAAMGKLEALQKSGGEGMNLEELDDLDCSAMAVMQLVKKGKESVREASDAVVAAELRRLEEENGQLRDIVTYERRAALKHGYAVLHLERDQKTLRDELEGKVQYITELESDRGKLREEREAEQEKSMCKICFAQARNTVILPCLHFLFCKSCMELHRDRTLPCPTCGVPVTGSMALYVCPRSQGAGKSEESGGQFPAWDARSA